MIPSAEAALHGVANAAASAAPHLAGPFVCGAWWRGIIAIVGIGLTLILSGPVVRFFILPRGGAPGPSRPRAGRFDAGSVIGKCENLLAVIFILSGELTALSLIFAAKSLVRSEEIRREPSYFLVGFLVNFVWSVLMGFLIRLIVIGI